MKPSVDVLAVRTVASRGGFGKGVSIDRGLVVVQTQPVGSYRMRHGCEVCKSRDI